MGGAGAVEWVDFSCWGAGLSELVWVRPAGVGNGNGRLPLASVSGKDAGQHHPSASLLGEANQAGGPSIRLRGVSSTGGTDPNFRGGLPRPYGDSWEGSAARQRADSGVEPDEDPSGRRAQYQQRKDPPIRLWKLGKASGWWLTAQPMVLP